MPDLNKTYEFACPHCRKPIVYNGNYYTREISRLVGEIEHISAQLTAAKGNRGGEYYKWRKQAIKALNIKKDQLRQLKANKRALGIQINNEKTGIFMRLVRSKLGDAEYIRLCKEAEELLTKCSTEEMIRTNKGVKVHG